MTTQQIQCHAASLNAVIHLYDALQHINWHYNREDDRRPASDDSAASAAAAFAAFVRVLEADGWRKFGHDGLGYIHDTDGRIEMRHIVDTRYVILPHAHVSYFPDYRDPTIPLTEEPEED